MYNIDFGAVAFANLLIIFILYNRRYGRVSPTNKRYEAVVFCAMVASGLDVLTAIMIDHAAQIPLWLNMLANSLCQISLGAIGICFVRYIYSFCNMLEKRQHVLQILDACMILYSASCLVNYYTHSYFWFDENYKYVHGPLYLVMYIVPLLLGLISLIALFLHRKPFGWKAKLVTLGICAIVAGCAIRQFVFAPNILLTIYGISVSMLTIMFLVETPNYRAIVSTMDEMEKDRIRANAANEAKSEFLARMSHEIRTPLNVVIGMNEIIMRETKEKNIFECAADAKSSATTLQHIINDILDMSRIESGKLEIIPEDYDLASVIFDLLTITYERAKVKNLKVEVNVDKELPLRLHGDDMRLKQILTNLLSNAVKYTEQGTVTLSVSGIKQDGKLKLHCAVKDTGIGIRKEDMERLFEAFTRVDEERNHKIEGTGLGLSITKQLLGLMGSELKVESEYGSGSVFSFELEQEIVDESPIGERKWRRRDAAASYSYKVSFVAPDVRLLVVDDNALNRKVVKNLLRPTLVQIDEAGDGFECLEKIKETKYDLILLDHLMPIMDGVETLNRMKSQCPNLSRGCPVVALTANAFLGAKEKYLADGFSDFVSKPINPILLEAMLVDLLPGDKLLLPEDSSAIDEEEIKKKQDAMIANLLVELPEIDGVNWDIGKEHFASSMDLKETMIEFYSTMDGTIRELEKLVRIDIHGYRIKVHALKSSAAMLGMLPISELAAMLEDAAKNDKKEQIDRWNPLLMEELRLMKGRLHVLVPDKPEPAPVLEEEVSMDTKRILIIDDSAMMLRSIKKMIESDYKVMLSTSGKQALHYLEEKELPDLIILDYEMPEMNGAEVFTKIRENAAWDAVPVLFLTGVTDEEHIESIMAMGPEGYLLKPPSEKLLKEKIAELLQEK